jgi:hypothetical protein
MAMTAGSICSEVSPGLSAWRATLGCYLDRLWRRKQPAPAQFMPPYLSAIPCYQQNATRGILLSGDSETSSGVNLCRAATGEPPYTRNWKFWSCHAKPDQTPTMWRHSSWLSGDSCSMGRQIETRVPQLGRLLMDMAPPCISMTLRTMNIPRPLPMSEFLVV